MINPLFLFMRWMQTVPLALLVFVPFQDKELRWARRKSCLAAFSFVLLGSVVLAALSPLFSLDGQRNIIARDAGLVVMMAAFFFGWSRVVRTSAMRKLLVGVILLHYDLALQAVSDVLAALVLQERYAAEVSAEAGSLTYDLCLLAANLLTFPLVWFFLLRVLRKNLPIIDDREAARGLGYLVTVALLFTAATYNPRFDLMPEVPIFVAVLIVTDMIAYYIFFQEIGTVRRRAETAQELAVWQIQYRQLSRTMEETRRLRHDLRHHLNTLSALNAQGNQEEIGSYLKRYGTVYDQLEKQLFSGDPVVDSVLEYYLTQAKEDGVLVEHRVSLEGLTGVEAMDMTVLLGNCLENALEALRELPEERRRLSIEMIRSGAVLLVRIRNSSMEPAGGEFTGWDAFSSRKEEGRQGLGLRSVAAIADKYGGSAQFRYGEGEFIARVVLNIACVQP